MHWLLKKEQNKQLSVKTAQFQSVLALISEVSRHPAVRNDRLLLLLLLLNK